MNGKIFRSSFLTSILVLIVSFVLILGILFDYFESRLMAELKTEASYVSHAVEHDGVEFINSFKGSDKRITLIDFDGTVIADTTSNAEKMDNHMSREEIEEAYDNGWGSSSRYSNIALLPASSVLHLP